MSGVPREWTDLSYADLGVIKHCRVQFYGFVPENRGVICFSLESDSEHPTLIDPLPYLRETASVPRSYLNCTPK